MASRTAQREVREADLDSQVIERIIHLTDQPDHFRSVKELLAEERLFESTLTFVDPSDYYPPLPKSRKSRKKMESMKAKKLANAKAKARKRAAQKQTSRASPPPKECPIDPPLQKKSKRAEVAKEKTDIPIPPPQTSGDQAGSSQSALQGGSYLGVHPVRAEPASSLKGSCPKIYREFVSAANLTPMGLMKVPLQTKVAMDVPAKTWTPRQEKFSEDMPLDDLLSTGTAHVGQALNYLFRAQSRLSEAASDTRKFKKLADDARNMFEAEVIARHEAEAKLKEALEEVAKLKETNLELSKFKDEVLPLREEVASLKDNLAQLEVAKERLLKELDEANNIEASLKREKNKLEAAVQDSYKEAVKKYKDSVEYEHDVDEIYYLTFKEIVEELEEKRPEVDISFLKEKLDLVYKKYLELMPDEVDEESLLSPLTESQINLPEKVVNIEE